MHEIKLLHESIDCRPLPGRILFPLNCQRWYSNVASQRLRQIEFSQSAECAVQSRRIRLDLSRRKHSLPKTRSSIFQREDADMRLEVQLYFLYLKENASSLCPPSKRRGSILVFSSSIAFSRKAHGNRLLKCF